MVKFIRNLVAGFRGTFITDCPACHLHFYGFHPYASQVKIKRKHYRIVCHRCAGSADNEKEM